MLIDAFTLFGSWPGSPYDHQVDEMISGLERFKIDRACTLSSKGIFFDAASGNEETWTVCRQNASLIPIGVTDPRIDGVSQVEYCKEKNFPLIALFPVSQKWTMSSVTSEEVLRQISEAGIPLMIEAGRDGDASAIYEATHDLTMPVILLDVSLRTLTEAMAVVRARPNTMLATRLLCGGDTIESLAESIGGDKLVFSSRFPVSCFSSAFLTAKYANIDETVRGAILGGNIARLLGV